MNQEEQERRGFFRIDDDVALSYRLVPASVVEQDAATLRIGEAGSLANELERMREVSRIHFRRVEKEAPEVARYLAHIDSKIDLLAQHIMIGADELFVKSTQAVNISGSGLAFTVNEPLNSDDFVEVRFALQPSLTSIKTYAKIVSCQPQTKAYRAAVEFVCLNDEDRDLLIRHVVKKQMNDIREHNAPS